MFDPKILDQFPTFPGVYLMKGEGEVVLYVGKAKNLKKRVKQYFIPGRDGREMIPFLISKIHTIEPIVVTSEKEALLLESNLIKQHQPHYNALLKDDKSYIALKINLKDEWPAVRLVRYRGIPERDGLYFGPYISAHAAREMLDILHKLFPLRRCSDAEFARRTRPCLLYQIHRCAGPCAGKCTHAEYQSHLRRTILFLKGQDNEILQDLYKEVNALSEQMEFEQAEGIYKTIRQIKKTLEVQHVDRPLGVSADSIAMYRSADQVLVVQLLFRHGRLVGSQHYSFKEVLEDDIELLSSFLIQRYQGEDIPSQIIVSEYIPEHQAIEEILAARKKSAVSIQNPQRKEKKILVQLAIILQIIRV